MAKLKTCSLLFSLSILIILFLAILFFMLNQNGGTTVVKTKVGAIEGVVDNDSDCIMYLGIPYGEVDRNNVFGKSMPYKKFTKVYKAFNESTPCPQYDRINNQVIGTLNCLKLNIYVPLKPSLQSPLPVLVFLTGIYIKTTLSKPFYGPKYLLNHDIIVITVNYRVGAYGFLCIEDPRVSGNQGIKDQILALEWIKNNIESFGGNPNKITLAGSGIDGEHVNLHLLYGNGNLFHKVIIDSGIFKKPYEHDKTFPITLELAKNLGCETDNKNGAIGFLNEQLTDAVINASVKLGLQYVPCIEKENKDAFLTVNKKPNFDNVRHKPIMITHADKEMAALHLHKKYKLNNIEVLVHDVLKRQFDFDEELHKNMEYYIRKFYVNNESNENEVMDGLIKFTTDVLNNYPTKRMIGKYLENEAKVSYGIFSYSGGRNMNKKLLNITVNGAIGGDVMGYIWDLPFQWNNLTTIEDQTVIDKVATMWANFVKFGDPTPEITPILPNKWDRSIKGKLSYTDLPSLMTFTSNNTEFSQRTHFWDAFFMRNAIYEIKEDIEPWI